jgi:hypothetical protein
MSCQFRLKLQKCRSIFHKHIHFTLGIGEQRLRKRDMYINRLGSALDAVARPTKHRVEKRQIMEELDKRKRELAMYGFLAGADHASCEVRERWVELRSRIE